MHVKTGGQIMMDKAMSASPAKLIAGGLTFGLFLGTASLLGAGLALVKAPAILKFGASIITGVSLGSTGHDVSVIVGTKVDEWWNG